MVSIKANLIILPKLKFSESNIKRNNFKGLLPAVLCKDDLSSADQTNKWLKEMYSRKANI